MDKNLRDLLGKLDVSNVLTDMIMSMKEADEKLTNDEKINDYFKSVGFDDKQKEAALSIMKPLTANFISTIRNLPSIDELRDDFGQKKNFDLVGEQIVPTLIKIALMSAVDYSLDGINKEHSEKEIKDDKDDEKSLLDAFFKAKEAFDKGDNKMSALCLKVAREKQSNEIVDLKFYNVFTREDISWNELEEDVKEALLEKLKEEKPDVYDFLIEKYYTEDDDEDFEIKARKEMTNFFKELLDDINRQGGIR